MADKALNRRINIYINGQQAAKSLKELVSDADRLTEELSQTTKGTDDFVKKSKQLAQVQARIDKLAKKYQEFQEAGKTLESLTKRQEELAEALKGDLGEGERKKLLAELKKVNEEYTTLNKILNGVKKEGTPSIQELKKVATQLRKEIESGTLSAEEYEKKMSDLRAINGKLDAHRKKLRGTANAWNKIKSSALKYAGAAAAVFTARAIVDFGKELFIVGKEMEVLSRKAQTVFGEALPQVTAAAEENANAMGLTVSQYTDAAAAIGDLLIPMQFTREEAANISTSLVDLSGALSEWTGGQKSAEEVTKILGKAILGEREELKQLGISIQEADVKQRLADKGLKNLTGTMLQQAKAAATLELITEKSADAQTAFANNSDTLVRKQAELSARFQDIKERLASALIPVFHRLLESVAPIVESTADMIEGFTSGEKASGAFGAAINILGIVISNAIKGFRLFFGIIGNVGSYLSDNFSGTIEFISVKLAQFYNLISNGANTLSGLLGIDVGQFEVIDIEAIKKQFEEARKAREDSGIDDPIPSQEEDSRPVLSPSREERIKQAENAEKLRKQREAEQKRREKQQQRHLQRLQDITTQFQEEQRLSQLDEDDKALAQLAAKYDKEIAIASELEAAGHTEATAQRLKLEQLKEQALEGLRQEQHEARTQKEQERQREIADAEMEAHFKQLEERRAFDQSLKEELDQILLSERELELQELEAHFQELQFLAEHHGLDITRIKEAHAKKQAEVERKFQEKEAEQLIQSQKEKAQLLSNTFGSIASVITSTIQLVGEESKKAAALSKILALAEISAKSAQAIAAATASAAGVPFPANIPAIATAVGTVLANFARARAIIQQRKKGGWFNVLGADDGLSYNAQYIGAPNTGLLPNHPVLLASGVLASEVGAEYFVSHRDLENPKVLNHVKAIEHITKARQFVNGGATAPLPEQQASAATPTATDPNLVTAINRLSTLLEKGVLARIDDDTVIDIRDRLNKLIEASGN